MLCQCKRRAGRRETKVDECVGAELRRKSGWNLLEPSGTDPVPSTSLDTPPQECVPLNKNKPSGAHSSSPTQGPRGRKHGLWCNLGYQTLKSGLARIKQSIEDAGDEHRRCVDRDSSPTHFG
jgi:hypothetical protein